DQKAQKTSARTPIAGLGARRLLRRLSPALQSPRASEREALISGSIAPSTARRDIGRKICGLCQYVPWRAPRTHGGADSFLWRVSMARAQSLRTAFSDRCMVFAMALNDRPSRKRS